MASWRKCLYISLEYDNAHDGTGQASMDLIEEIADVLPRMAQHLASTEEQDRLKSKIDLLEEVTKVIENQKAEEK